jgi:hypothetical protein
MTKMLSQRLSKEFPDSKNMMVDVVFISTIVEFHDLLESRSPTFIDLGLVRGIGNILLQDIRSESRFRPLFLPSLPQIVL